MDASYSEPLSDAVPTSYALLRLPPRHVMRDKGYDPQHVYLNGSEAHPLATWSTHTLPAGATYKTAVAVLQEANQPRWGLLKARLHFSDGAYEVFARRVAHVPASFGYAGRYDPNSVYRHATAAQSAQQRRALHTRLQPLVDARGHGSVTSSNESGNEGGRAGARPRPRTFAPEVLYKNCPPPLYAQAGFDFTPVSYNAFLLKPHDRPVGVRPLQSSFMHSSTDYRPRAYARDVNAVLRDSRHCHCGEVYQVGDYTLDLARHADVVDHRNRLTRKEVTTLQTVKPHSSIVGRRHARDPRFPSTTTTLTRSTGGDGVLPPQQQQQEEGVAGGNAAADQAATTTAADTQVTA